MGKLFRNSESIVYTYWTQCCQQGILDHFDMPSTNRISLHKVVCWRLGCQCKSSKCVHDKVHPEKLRSERTKYMILMRNSLEIHVSQVKCCVVVKLYVSSSIQTVYQRDFFERIYQKDLKFHIYTYT
jgi:hypothetical protein